MFLQTVDLFTYCSAEQLMRIAAIARQSRYEPDQAIYRANDPAEALYCIFEGQVRLLGGEAPERILQERQTLGVRDILSDRLRGEDAVAKCGVTVLVIDADDFFDLLSNNIEIVKALFRWLLQPKADERAGSRTQVEHATAASPDPTLSA